MDAIIIEKKALQLPEAERALLADKLLESISRISPETRESWIKESENRMQAFREGKVDAVEGTEAIAELQAQFRK
jgi:hypothetical protein